MAKEELAQLPTIEEMLRFVEDKKKVEEIEKEMDALKGDKSDEAAKLRQELAEKALKIESLQDELKKKEMEKKAKKPMVIFPNEIEIVQFIW